MTDPLPAKREMMVGAGDLEKSETEVVAECADTQGRSLATAEKPEDSKGEVGEAPALAPKRLSTPRVVILAVMMMLTYFLGAASSSSVVLLIPSIANTLGTTELKTQWVASAYTIAYACGLLFSGSVADVFGRRIIYISGLCLCAASCLPTALIRNLAAMCVLRAFAGIGLAMASSSGFGIVGTNVIHEPARTITFAAFGLGNPVGGAVGTLIGGVIAGNGGDRWANQFFFLMGLAILLAVLACFIVPDNQTRTATTKPRIDWFGGLLITAAIALFTFSLTSSGSAPDGWKTPYVLGLLPTSFCLLAIFIVWCLRRERLGAAPPLMKLSLFSRNGYTISYICACGLFTNLSVSGWTFTTSLFYQNYQGLDPLDNAIHVLTATVTGVIAAGSMMLLAPRVSVPRLLIPATLLTATCSLLYAVRPEGLVFWALEFPAQLCIPWGVDFMLGLGNILMSNLLRKDEQSTGGGLFRTAGLTGSALGVSITALIAHNFPGLRGLRAAFWFTVACELVVFLLVVVGLRTVGLAKDVVIEKQVSESEQ